MKARDKEVTWQVTWCDVIGLEHGKKGLEDNIRAPGVHMVALSKEWGRHEDKAWTIGQA